MGTEALKPTRCVPLGAPTHAPARGEARRRRQWRQNHGRGNPVPDGRRAMRVGSNPPLMSSPYALGDARRSLRSCPMGSDALRWRAPLVCHARTTRGRCAHACDRIYNPPPRRPTLPTLKSVAASSSPAHDLGAHGERRGGRSTQPRLQDVPTAWWARATDWRVGWGVGGGAWWRTRVLLVCEQSC